MKTEITYIGRVEGTSYLIHKYLMPNGEPMAFKNKVTKLDKIGDVIECEQTEKGVRGPYKKVGNHTIDDDLRKWDSRDKAVFYEFNLEKRLTKKLPQEHLDAIRILRKSYRELYGVQRQNFINHLIHEICKY